jgi:ligand-binding SRPBCC domain-containing protein
MPGRNETQSTQESSPQPADSNARLLHSTRQGRVHRSYTLYRQQMLALQVPQVFSFFADASNLEVITPPWLHFRNLAAEVPKSRKDALIDYRLCWRGLPIRWRTRISVWDPPHRFVDVQLIGPYRYWRHTHLFEAEGQGTRMTDVVDYALPFGVVGALAHRLVVASDLEAIFDFRAQRVASLFCIGGSKAGKYRM